MASLFIIPQSPFWYLSYKDKNGWVKKSTGLRVDDPNETMQAKRLRADAESKEYGGRIGNAGGWDWVEPWLRTTGYAARTLERYLTAWGWVSLWLARARLGPADVRYEHAAEYLQWRVGRKKKTGKTAGRNTAIQEVKFLSMVMSEAVPRRLIQANPLVKLKLKPDTKKKKPALSDEEVDKCLVALEGEDEWMRVAFQIALATGCRLRETRIPLDAINLDLPVPEMTFPAPKGGEDKAFTIPVPTSLIPLFKKMRTKKRKWTITAFPFQPSRGRQRRWGRHRWRLSRRRYLG